MFKQVSIKLKIVYIILIITLLTSALGSIVDFVFELKFLKKNLVHQLVLDAKLIGDYSVMPMEFGYPERAKEVLEKFNAQPHIVNAAVYNVWDSLFVSLKPIIHKSEIRNNLKQSTSWFKGDMLYVFEPIKYKNRLYGTVFLQSHTDYYTFFTYELILTLAIFIFTIILAWGLSLRLHHFISAPILNLANISDFISKTGVLDKRVNVTTDDEIGQLAQKFNFMLDSIKSREEERDHALKNLRENENLLKEIIDNSPAVIYLKETSGKYILTNKEFEKIFNLNAKDIIGKADPEIFPFDISSVVSNNDQQVISQKKAFQFEEYVPYGDELHTFLSIKFPIFDSSTNEVVSVCGISTDITERKHTEEKVKLLNEKLEELVNERTKELQKTLNELKSAQVQLIHSEKMASLGVLTAGVAHEINNPVNFISSNLIGLKEILEDLGLYIEEVEKTFISQGKEEFKQLLIDIKNKYDYDFLNKGIEKLSQNIQKGVERSSEIILGLKSFSRTDDNDFVMANIHENIDSTLVILFHQYKNKVEIVKDYGYIPEIKCFPGLLNQVFMNIIGNAIQAIENNGTITIKTWYNEFCKECDMQCEINNAPSQKCILISIADTGHGITEENLSKIYEPFFTTKKVGEGTGLGLSISYNIIEKHKGSIHVKSEPGKGTEFIIRLPYIF